MKINRLALLTFGSVRKSTPTVGLEAMGFLPPLDLYLQGEVIKTWLRIHDIRKELWNGVGTSLRARGHRLDLQKLMDGFPLPVFVMDEMPEVKKWNRLYQVDLDFQSGIPLTSSIMCFTDGAKLNNASTGAGYCITSPHRILETDSFPMGTAPSVFQAELTALFRAAEGLLPYAKQGPIVLHSDSQAALLALNSPIITSKLVLATAHALDILALTCSSTVKLTWVKAHAGHAGNVLADSLAKRGAATATASLDQVIPLPKSHYSTLIDDEVVLRWNRR
jgi:ribonuclease HI